MSAVELEAVISADGVFRYYFACEVQASGPVVAYFGVNGSTASAEAHDHTTRKWREFTRLFGGRRYVVANPFAFRATDVRELASARDPVGPENARWLRQVIEEADILVPCWGNRSKVPPRLRGALDDLRFLIFSSGKPVKVFGFTQSGDPKHPLMLGYDTPLVDWVRS